VRPYLWDAAVSAAPIWIARGVQNKVLEATAAGLPSVVTPAVFDGLPPQVRSACRVGDTAESFADALVGLLQMPAASRRCIAERASLADLAWDTQLFPFLNLVETAAFSAAAAT
jgi:hypothetical protein